MKILHKVKQIINGRAGLQNVRVLFTATFCLSSNINFSFTYKKFSAHGNQCILTYFQLNFAGINLLHCCIVSGIYMCVCSEYWFLNI